MNRYVRPMIAATAAVVLLAGCSSSSDGSSSSGSTSAAAGGTASGSASGDPLEISLIVNDAFDPFYLTLVKGAEDEAEKLGIDLTWQAAQETTAASQTTTLQSVAAKKPDGIIMSVQDGTAMVASMKSVMDSGIPIITVDSDANDTSARLGTVKSDGEGSGKLAAEWANTYLGGTGKVGYIGYTPGIQSVDLRKDGWDAAIKTYPGLTVVDPQYAEVDLNQNAQKVSALLSRTPDVGVIFASWTNATLGAAQAVQEAGSKAAIIGLDASPDEVALLRQGKVAALVVQKALDMGAQSVDEMAAYLQDGTEPSSDVLLESIVVTQDNIDDPDVAQYLYVDPEGK